jgi:hypothetical protein
MSLGFWIAAIAASLQTVVTDYSIATIDYAPTPLQQVGKVQAGLICLPKGRLRWRDVARPGDHAVTERIESVLRGGGLAVAPQPDPLYADAPPATQYRIRIVVADASLTLCVAGDVPFVGKVGRAPKTRGVVTVRWETYDRMARRKVDAVTYEIPVDDAKSDVRSASHVISDALVDSARRYAATRVR